MSQRLRSRVEKLEAAKGSVSFKFYVPVDPENPQEIAEARKIAKAEGKILVVVSEDDLRL